jgi:hypothetical protein
MVNIFLVLFLMVIGTYKFVYFFKIFQLIGIWVLKVVSDDSLDFLSVCYYLSFFISDFTNLGLFPAYFSQNCQGLVNLYFFKDPAFCFIDSLYFFFFGLYFINFGSYFSVILIYTLTAINFHLKTTFTVSHRFW